MTGTWLENDLNVFSSICRQDIPILNNHKCQFISYRFEISTITLNQEQGHCTKHNPLFDSIKIPLWVIIFVCLAGVSFTRFSAPPPLFLSRPGVISMRINVAINHSVPPLPDVIQGLLKTSALCDVYGRREICAWQPSPKTLVQSPSGTLIQSVSYYCPGSSQRESNVLFQRQKQSKPGLTDSCTQFLINGVHKRFSRHSHTHTFCCVFLFLPKCGQITVKIAKLYSFNGLFRVFWK